MPIGTRLGVAVRRFLRPSRVLPPCLVAVFCTTCTDGAAGQDPRGSWPQWRGPTRDGHCAGPDWPANLRGDNLQLLWRADLGPSYSGPVVTPDRVFVVEMKDKSDEIVRALDRVTGKELWHAQWKGFVKTPSYARPHGDWTRSTPAYDDGCLYVGGMRDVLVCLDAATGTERWRLDFVEHFKTPVPVFGFVCSPLVDGGAVYAQAAAAVVKVDKKSGQVLWRSFPDDRGPNGSAVSSPVVAQVAGSRQLLVQNRRKLGGLDPETGAVLWSEEVPALNSMNIVSPVAYHDGVFTSAYGGRSFLFALSRQNSHWKARKAWDNKAQAYMSTPVVVGDFLYMQLRSQRLTCLDLKTGKERWTSPETFGQYVSLVAQKDRILALDQRGLLYLLRANPQTFELLDSRPISDGETWAHLAVAGDELFIRELNALAVYRWAVK